MKNEIFIGIVVALSVAIILGIHRWLHSTVKFKIDESAIINFFDKSNNSDRFRSTEAISASTDISLKRVAEVCHKSKRIRRNAKEKESWCLK